ncbi:MAG TPA: DUF4199 domain-containing protein [Chitinophagales bacterium]|nr:DUF4199 domain-containing protein [Chitinophagales bacterium]
MKTKTPIKFGLQWGIICGIYCVIAIMILYIMGIKYFAGFFRFMPSILYYVLFLIGAFQLRKAQGGFISFKDVFVALIICSAVVVVINTIFAYILQTVIDPNLPDEVKKYWMDWTYNWMNGKVPDEKIQETLKEMEGKDYGMSVKNMLIGLPMGVGLDAIIILIIAAIVKRKNPMAEFGPMTIPNPPEVH